MGEQLPTPVVHHFALEWAPDSIWNIHQSLQTLQERVLDHAVEPTPQETSWTILKTSPDSPQGFSTRPETPQAHIRGEQGCGDQTLDQGSSCFLQPEGLLQVQTPSGSWPRDWLSELRPEVLNRINRDVSHQDISMKTLSSSDQRNINLFSGKRNQSTLQKFDSLSHQFRRSRAGTLDFLITHYEWFQNNRSEVVRWISPFDSRKLITRCSKNFKRRTRGAKWD